MTDRRSSGRGSRGVEEIAKVNRCRYGGDENTEWENEVDKKCTTNFVSDLWPRRTAAAGREVDAR